MQSPIVSVIIPCYNAEKYLKKCLDSIIYQTLNQIEVICIDDGSTDNTIDILKNYAIVDKRFVIITQKNINAGAARNRGLDVARGKYLSFLDADDFFESEMLEKMVLTAELYTADFVVCHSNQYYMDSDMFLDTPWVVRDEYIPPYVPFSYRQFTDNPFRVFTGWAWDKLYRKSFVKEHNLYFQEQRTSNDLLFVFSALFLAKKIAIVEGLYVHQRRGGNESLSVTREKSWYCFYNALIALKERMVDEGLFWELERDFVNYALHFSLWNLDTLVGPTHDHLKVILRKEWFKDLGITDKPKDYFYDVKEYKQFLRIMRG